jgi:two-component system response regulator DegU
MNTKVLIVDDHKMFRDGLRGLINAEPGMEVVGEAVDGKEAIELARQLVPNVVIMDINMRYMNGIEATLYLSKELPSINVLILSLHSSSYLAEAVKGSGARGYVLKGADAKELVEAVRLASKQLPYWSPCITADK